MPLEWNKVILVGVIVSILLFTLPTLFKGGEFDIANIEELKEQVSPIWSLILLGLGCSLVYTLLYKYKKKETWGKKDLYFLIVIVGILYVIWTEFLSPAYFNILTQSTAYFMNAVGAFP